MPLPLDTREVSLKFATTSVIVPVPATLVALALGFGTLSAAPVLAQEPPRIVIGPGVILLGSALGHGLWAFLRSYVVKRGFLDGRLGFVLAVYIAEGTYYRYLKMAYPPKPVAGH